MKPFLYLLPLILIGCSTVEPGNVGVETSWGHVTGTVYSEGTHATGPGTDLHEMSVRMQNLEEQDIPCRAKDNVAVAVDVTVSYTLDRAAAAKVYKQLGDNYAALAVLPATRSVVRDAVASVEALQAAQQRPQLEQNVERELRESLAQTLRNQHLPINAVHIDSVQLRNLDLPRTLTASIEAIQRQRNAALEREQALVTAQQEAARLRVEAEGRNAVAILEAQRQAEVRRIMGDSEASYNRTVSPSLTAQLVELRRIDAQRAILENPNAHLVILGGGGGGGGGSPIVLQAPPLTAQ